jgi:large subunit ribosomal protein L36
VQSSFSKPSVPLLLRPSLAMTPVAAAGMKWVANPKKRCKDCYFEVKDEVLYVLCPTHARHRQGEKKLKPKHGWIMTHATQGAAGGHGQGRRQMWTQQSFRLDF